MIKNQLHGPRPKKQTTDDKGNKRCRLWLKDGDTTMLITKELTHNAAQVFVQGVNNSLELLGGKRLNKNRFLITP